MRYEVNADECRTGDWRAGAGRIGCFVGGMLAPPGDSVALWRGARDRGNPGGGWADELEGLDQTIASSGRIVG